MRNLTALNHPDELQFGNVQMRIMRPIAADLNRGGERGIWSQKLGRPFIVSSSKCVLHSATAGAELHSKDAAPCSFLGFSGALPCRVVL
jgi:hypothetical protein